MNSDVSGWFGVNEEELRLSNQRNEHARLSPVSLVPLAMEAYQITLLEAQGEEDGGGRCQGEDKVSDGHRRSCPESEEKAEHNGMTDPAIVAWAVLGHSSPVVTEVYAELDQAKASEAMERVG
jgi:hypothetical protein